MENKMADLLTDPEPKEGLYQKYMVCPLHDPEYKHAHCKYFVLDLIHDPYSIPALRAYAKKAASSYLVLAQEINLLCDELENQPK